MQKEIHIRFSSVMLRAILDGRKTQTRRIIKPQPVNDAREQIPKAFTRNGGIDLDIIKCRYGNPGDILWFRETWARFPSMELIYKADGTQLCKSSHPTNSKQNQWQPSIFMPKDAARIWLQVESIKVERLQDITEADAITEGVEMEFDTYRDYLDKDSIGNYPFTSAKESFKTLWQSIHGEESWQANLWLWVVQFKILSLTGRPHAF